MARACYELPMHMRPHVRISPFSPLQYERVLREGVPKSDLPVMSPEYWSDGAKDIGFFDSGRSALLTILILERLKPLDEVAIITTTQGAYISNCVTSTIEKVCRWTRTIGQRTRLALVIHEFGFPCTTPEIAACQEMGMPIVEDCAYAVGSRTNGAAIGTFGDYVFYSLTKHYPVPFGGILVTRKNLPSGTGAVLRGSKRSLLARFIQQSHSFLAEWAEGRRKNWEFFANRLYIQNIRPFFRLPPDVVPGAFVFQLPETFQAASRKQSLVDAGVEATEYYQMGGFYFPAHQFLTDYEREYILYHFSRVSG